LDAEALASVGTVAEFIERAQAVGVSRFITVGSGWGAESAERAVAIAHAHPDCVWATVGVHPHDASQYDDEVEARLRVLAGDSRVVALGEMGLDFYYDHSDRLVQREVFRSQIRLALALDLPIVIHDRDSQGETFRILCEENAFDGDGAVLFHCFAGDVGAMKAIVDKGGWISLSGIVTFKNATQMHDVARETPGDRLLVETDAPYLAPVPWRGRTNEPRNVVYTLAHIAGLRDQPIDTLAQQTAQNTATVFRLPELG
jgi:TatD DNase family protein